MSFSVSNRQFGRTRAEVSGLLRHEFRDVDRANGTETRHSNERIVPGRTKQNRSWLFVDGKSRPVNSIREIEDELDARLSRTGGLRTDKKTGKVRKIATRKDAGVVRDVVLQLDPEFTRSSKYLLDNPDELKKVWPYYKVMIDVYASIYGKHNLLAASLHLDETSPHLHLLVTPIDDEGRVRQQSFIKSGRGKASEMSQFHSRLRDRLREAGYDADEEPRGAGRSHLSPEQYADWQQRQDELAAREVEVEDEREMLRRERAALDDERAALADEHRAVRALHRDLQKESRRVASAMATVDQTVEEVREYRDSLEAVVTKMQRMPRALYDEYAEVVTSAPIPVSDYHFWLGDRATLEQRTRDREEDLRKLRAQSTLSDEFWERLDSPAKDDEQPDY